MGRLLKLAGSIFLVLMFCLSFTADSVAAATKDTKATQQQLDKDKQKAMRIFRNSVLATTNDENQIFHQFLIFLMPSVESELSFNAKVGKNTLDAAGEFGFWLRPESGESIDNNIPFYIQQEGKDIAVYYKTEEQWKKFIVPAAAASLAEAIVSPTNEEIEKEIAMIKEVSVLQESDARRTLLVTLDGNKLADEMKLQMEKNSAKDATANSTGLQEKLLKCIDQGFRNSNVWYIWTIDKVNNRTIAFRFDLSSIIQESARAALSELDNTQIGDATTTEFIREMLERLAFYSEFKAYTTLMNPSAQNTLLIPQEVIDSAQLVEAKVPSEVPAAN